MNQAKIGKYIADKRKGKGLTQAQLAEKIGVGDKAVSKWERGLSLPDASKYQQVCDILGITLNEFFAGEDLAAENISLQADKNLREVSLMELRKRKNLKKIIILLLLTIVVLVAVLISTSNIKRESNDNRVGNLTYRSTTADSRYTHYSDGEAMTGVTLESDGKMVVTRKIYFSMDMMNLITVEQSQYKNYEDAFDVLGGDVQYKEYKRYAGKEKDDITPDKAVKEILVGTLEGGGVMAWIYTDAGIYTIKVESMRMSDEDNMDELIFFLKTINIDKTLKPEVLKQY